MALKEFIKKVAEQRKKIRVASDGLLADQASLNLGTLFRVSPAQAGLTGAQKLGREVRLLNIEGDDADGETIMITLQQEVTLLQASPQAVPGPLIGVVEFGSGSGLARIEFDIPSPVGGPAPNFSNPAAQTPDIFIPQKNNVVTLVLPASSLRVLARNDARTGFLLNFNGSTINMDTAKMPAQVRIHAAYGKSNMIRERLHRIYYIAGGGDSLAIGSTVAIGVPAYARRVFFPRNPANQPIDIFLQDYYGGGYSLYTLPGDSFESIPILPHTNAIQITNPAGNPQAFSTLAAVFELGF